MKILNRRMSQKTDAEKWKEKYEKLVADYENLK